MVTKTYEEINTRIKNGEAVVVTAEEILGIIDEIGIEEATRKVDVVTTATFGPMCSSGAFLNFGHSSPPIRMEHVMLNQVEAYAGLAAVDAYIGATQESVDRGYEYGGAHVICDLIDGKQVHLKARAKGTDCYPRKEIDTYITKDDINEAYIYNPRNCYQNYNAAINTSGKRLYTYMGVLSANQGNVTYSTSGELSPLLNDPLYRTIGIGTRIFLGGAIGYVSWMGTQFKSGAPRGENDVPLTPAGTLALSGDLKAMSTKYIKPAVFEHYGTSMFVGVGIPIPVLDEDIMRHLSIRNSDITTNVIDYSDPNHGSIKTVTYAELRSGTVDIDGKKIKTSSLSSLKKAREIAAELKSWILKGEFMIQEPVHQFEEGNTLKGLKDVKKEVK
jgi:uncharacterized protein (DUF39 family)